MSDEFDGPEVRSQVEREFDELPIVHTRIDAVEIGGQVYPLTPACTCGSPNPMEHMPYCEAANPWDL